MTSGTAKRTSRRNGTVKEVIERVDREGHAGWRVRDANGDIKVIRSSKSSNTAMDRAMTKYDGALRRLANR